MGILEDVINMKNQGMSDYQIAGSLQQQGKSPKEINDALNQAQIKSAVSAEEYGNQPDMMSGEGLYSPQTQEMYQDVEEQAPAPEESYSENAYAPQEPQQQQQYEQTQGNYNAGYSGAVSDADTIIEISEQVFLEKSKTTQKQLDKLEEFKTIAETKVDNISERLKKIENIIDRLEVTILEKVGSYGSNLESIKKEMSMIEDSFGKVMKGSSATLRKTSPETPARRKNK